MIGNYARGFRHLTRIVENSKTKKVFIIQGSRIMKGECIFTKLRNSDKKALIIFQNMGGDNDIFKFRDEDRSIAEKLLSKYGRYFRARNSADMYQLGRRYFIVDEIFESEYEKFRNGNKKLLDQVYGKYCYHYDTIAEFMFALIGNSPNLYVWAITSYYKNNVTYNTIEHIVRFSNNYSQLVGKLSKGTITAYNSREKVRDLIDEIVMLRGKKRANDSINSFNTTQKKLLKKIELNDKTVKILNRFGRLSNQKKHNFIRKMSTIEDVDDILHQMSLLSNIHFEWNRESFLDYIHNAENINCEVMFDENNIVLVKVNTFDTVKLLAKTTNWCISKNKKYWNDYIEYRNDSNQFVIFDFNKPEDHELSIVGFTTSKGNGITNAHSFSNANLMGGCSGNNNRLTSFLVKSVPNNIHSIISGNKIPLNKILNLSKNNFNWNFDSFMSFLNYCINEDDYIIHYADRENGKIVISTRHENVRFLIGKNYVNVYDSNNEVFVFYDFLMDDDDPDRLHYCFITNDSRQNEEVCTIVFNANSNESYITFDSLLEDFDMPYDTISRTNNVFKRFSNAFRNYDIKTLKKLINDENVLHGLKGDEKRTFQQTSYNVIYDSIFNYHSFDFINLIYDNGKTLYDFLGTKNVDDLLISLIYEINNAFRGFGRVPNEKDIDMFNEGEFNQRIRPFIAHFIILEKMIKNENHKNFGNRLIEVFFGLRRFIDLDIYLSKFLINKLDFSVKNTTNLRFVRIVASLNDKELNETLLNVNMSNELAKDFIQHLYSSAPLYNEFIKKYNYVEDNKTEETTNVGQSFSWSISDLVSSTTYTNPF